MSPATFAHDATTPEKDRQYVTALARGLQILRCFSHERAELTPREIVRLTGLPQPTVWRLCYTLTKEGFIVCVGDGHKMALGLPALSLGYAALSTQTLPKAALPLMQSFTERHRVGVSLAVRDGLEMLYLQRTHGDFVYMNDPVGARRPLALAPTGLACLVVGKQDERKAVLEALKRQSRTEWEAMKSRLDQADADYRRHGCVFGIGVMHERMNTVAVPICSPRSGQVYGLSASGLAAEWPKKKLLALSAELVAVANELTVAAD